MSEPVTHLKFLEFDPPKDAGRKTVWDDAVAMTRALRGAREKLYAPAQRCSAYAEELYETRGGGFERTRAVLHVVAGLAERAAARLDVHVFGYSRQIAVWEAIRRSVGDARTREVKLADWAERSTYSTVEIGGDNEP